ncbi:hypothetical protein D9M71_556280 [compost metagenome]
MLVGGGPGIYHLVGGYLGAQHFTNGAQQAGADNGVLLGQHLQGHVFVDDLAHQRAEGFQLIDVSGVHQYAVGQGTGLIAAGLVGLVEQRPHFRVFTQHDLVEVAGQRLPSGFQQGHGGFDDGTLLAGQHRDSVIGWVFLPLLIQHSCQLFILYKSISYTFKCFFDYNAK